MTPNRYVQRVRFHVLGTLSVTADGIDLPLGGPQQRLVLALLISAEGKAVSTSQLISGVWGEEPPPTARKALQGNIHRLRSELGDVIVTESNGYSLTTGGNVDALEFVRLHGEGESLVQSAPENAAEILREALELWNGPAYADLSDELALAPEIARLENLRLAAVGDRIDADLALGRHEALIGELEGLTLEHPFQERFWAQHMTALYRAGRQTEALRSFERLRRFLADESGLEPSEEMKSLEEKILSQDPSLTVEAEAEPGSDPAAIRGYELREKVASDDVSETYRAYQRSVGRQVAVRVIGPRVANDPVFISNFLADTKRVAAVDHPHISYVFDTWREPGKAYQVSRWLGGGTLEEALPGGVRTAISILTDIGDALSHAHRHGVAHGSVDASHVLFDEAGHPYLTGFVVGREPSDDDLARDRFDFAVLAHEVMGGSPPRQVDGRLHPVVGDSSIETVFEVAFSDEGYRRIEDFLRALRQAAGADVVASHPESPPRTDARNPYKGLKAFQEADADDFYGRDQLVDRLAKTLDRRRLVAVVGPSGSGKSSAVKAGLVPQLRSSSELRLVTEMYPGAFPFEELEGALLRVGVDRTSLIEDLVSDDRGLLRVLKQIIPSDDAELVLIIDQFEELFSTVDDERTRKLFLDSLVNAVSEPRSRLRLVITMRADFFDRPLEHPRFGELLEAGLIPITLPADGQLAQATVMPARSEGVEFEDGLVSQIVSDVSGQPGGLPLLEYALTELFDSRDSDILTLSAYQRSGGVHGALGRRAEEIYEDLPPSQQSSVREAFLRMVSVDENADDLRRRVRRSDLSGTGRSKGLDSALQAYAAARLITFDRDPVTRGPTVEVAHEALLREWTRLRDWIEEQRDDLVIRRRLVTALEEWKQSGEDDGYLPTGSRLAQFEQWATETELVLSSSERAFLQAGVEKESEREARKIRRRNWIMSGFGLAAVVASIFGLLALRNADIAGAESLAAAAIEQIDEDPERSVLLALQSLGTAETPNGLTALHQALQSHRTLWTEAKECEFCGEFEALHPDGVHVVTVDSTGSAKYWDTRHQDAEPIWTRELTGGATANYSRGWFDLDKNQITIPLSDLGRPDIDLTDSADGTYRGLYTLDLDSGDVVNRLPLEGCVKFPFFPPFDTSQERPALGFVVYPSLPDDPSRCDVTGFPSGFMVRPDAFATETVSLDIPEHAWQGTDWWWDLSRDSRLLTFSSSAGSYLLDAQTGEVIKEYPEHWRATLAPGNQQIFLYDEGANVDLKSIESNERLNRYPGPISWMRFSPDRSTLYGLSFEQGVNVIDPESGRRTMTLRGPETRPVGLRFGGQSDRILVATPIDRRLWNVQTNLSELQPTPSEVIPQGDFVPHKSGITVAGDLILVPGFMENGIGYAIYESSGELIRKRSSLWAFMSPDGSMILEVPILESDVESPSGFQSELAGRPRLVEARSGELITTLRSTCPFYVHQASRGWETAPGCDEDDLILPLSDAEFSDDLEVLALASANGTQTVFDLNRNDVIFSHRFSINENWAPSIGLDPGGKIVVFQQGSPPFTMTAVELDSGQVMGSIDACNPNSEMLFSDDSSTLYTADWCSDVALFDTKNWTEIARFGRGQGGALDDIAVSGDLAATAGADNVIRVWNLNSGEVILEVSLNSQVPNVEFLDDDHVMAVGVEGDVLVFTLDPEELKEIALDRLTRGFTEEECGIYDIDPCPSLEEIRSAASS